MNDIQSKLRPLAKEIEAVIMKHTGGEKPGMAVAITLPPDYEEVHWITNLSRADGINLLASTARKMTAQAN